MTQDQTTEQNELLEFGRRWAAAEVAKDLDTLEAIAHPDLRLVGPFGFVLDRDAWINRYRSGQLDTTRLDWDQVEIRVFGDTAVMIGRQSQDVTFQGRPNKGDFRISHLLVRDPDARYGWLIAHLQLSQLVAPGAAPAGPPAGGQR